MLNLKSLSADAQTEVRGAFANAGYTYTDEDEANAGRRLLIKAGEPTWTKVGVTVYDAMKVNNIVSTMTQKKSKAASLADLFDAAWDEDDLAGVNTEAMSYLKRKTDGLSSLSVTGSVFSAAYEDGLILCQDKITVGGYPTVIRFLTDNEKVATDFYFSHLKADLKRAYDRVGRKFQPVLDIFPNIEKKAKQELAQESGLGVKALESRTPRALTSGEESAA